MTQNNVQKNGEPSFWGRLESWLADAVAQWRAPERVIRDQWRVEAETARHVQRLREREEWDQWEGRAWGEGGDR